MIFYSYWWFLSLLSPICRLLLYLSDSAPERQLTLYACAIPTLQHLSAGISMTDEIPLTVKLVTDKRKGNCDYTMKEQAENKNKKVWVQKRPYFLLASPLYMLYLDGMRGNEVFMFLLFWRKWRFINVCITLLGKEWKLNI